ncbi:WD repeat domain 35 family protein [Besnoitia besnoiti]|uniref:WD repeat domain 35 family protein n=1 Tax=Besnoitia besnoiti TaxID=94643 RepID=A0A2A9M4X5_BESBE|nr:WD repeat domain 35 family protein [Besnoitia besnoiti]PFH33538.1 WD repeat domain 35 family protein [Besnoitia besnoiti]
MFAFFTKKVTPSRGAAILSVSWQSASGWLALGYKDGTLKVLETCRLLDAGGAGACARDATEIRSRDDSDAHNLQNLSSPSSPDAIHTTGIHLVSWNDGEGRLTSVDESGCIAIWRAEGKHWVNELINIDHSKQVVDTAWTADEQKVCILYADGNLVLGTVTGQRLWSKDLQRAMVRAAWSPDGRKILLCSKTGEIFFYDSEGLYSHRLRTQLGEDCEGRTEPLLPVAGVHWRRVALQHAAEAAESLSLAIAYENGRIQLFRDDADAAPISFETCLRRCFSIRWHPTLPVLAVFGDAHRLHPDAPGAESASRTSAPPSCVIRFYDVAKCAHLHTLVVPGHATAQAFSWESRGERLVVAAGSALLFAAIRMRRPATYFGETLVYSSCTALTRRRDLPLWFWNVGAGRKHLRHVRAPLRHLLSHADRCGVITDAEEEDDDSGEASGEAGEEAPDYTARAKAAEKRSVRRTYALSVCNAMGEPVTSTFTDIEPEFAAMSASHILVADRCRVFLWRYSSRGPNPLADNSQDAARCGLEDQPAEAATGRNAAETCSDAARLPDSDALSEGPSEMVVEVDAAEANRNDNGYSATGVRQGEGGAGARGNPVVALAAAASCFVVARRSGELRRYSLPSAQLEAVCDTGVAPLSVHLNCDATRVAVIDIFHKLSLRSAAATPRGDAASETCSTNQMPTRSLQPSQTCQAWSSMSAFGAALRFSRQDVSDVLWSRDEADLFAMAEKNTTYLVRGTVLEEPLSGVHFLAGLSELCLDTFNLEALSKTPGEPNARLHRFHYETKRLRDTREILKKANELGDAVTYAEQASHPSLWKLIAQHALEKLNLEIAEKAFINCEDYCGLQCIKRLRTLRGAEREAEIRAYFGDFERAETLYLSVGRRDLAVSLRAAVGDWSRVLELARDAPESLGPSGASAGLQWATKALGDSCREKGQWREAIEAYRSIRDHQALAHGYYFTEQFDELVNLVGDLRAERDRDLLREIGKQFTSVGLCREAVRAFTKAGDVQAAVECCVRLNAWDTALTLAGKAPVQQIETLLTKCAGHLVEQGKRLQAVKLYQRAGKPLEAAKIIMQLAAMGGAGQRAATQLPHYRPDRKKKLYVLAALEIQKLENTAAEGVAPSAAQPHLRRTTASCSAATPTGERRASPRADDGAENPKSPFASRSGIEAQSSAEALALVSPMQREAPPRHDLLMSENKALRRPWQGAEAFHLYLLCHKQLVAAAYDAAACAAVRLTEYPEFIDGLTAHAVLALASFYARNWQLCSRAFLFLENAAEVPPEQRKVFADLAVEIFSRHPPPASADDSLPLCACPKCRAPIHCWMTSCPECCTAFAFCVASGRPIYHYIADRGNHTDADELSTPLMLSAQHALLSCRTCHHKMYAAEARNVEYCPLCHAPLSSGIPGVHHRHLPDGA